MNKYVPMPKTVKSGLPEKEVNKVLWHLRNRKYVRKNFCQQTRDRTSGLKIVKHFFYLPDDTKYILVKTFVVTHTFTIDDNGRLDIVVKSSDINFTLQKGWPRR